jgi:membrane-associated phospholipid phosphatase
MSWRLLRERALSELKLKLGLTVILNLCFYVPYGLVQRHLIFAPTQMLPTFLDRWIPFFDQAVWVYLSIILLLPAGPLLMSRRDQLLRYGAGMLLIECIACSVFLFWPTWCARPAAAETSALYQVLVSMDAPLNACPSLHAAFAVFSGLVAARIFCELRLPRSWRFGIGAWTGLILLATLLTKQHTLPDILAGSALGAIAFCLVFDKRIVALNLKISPRMLNEPKIRPSSTTL